MVRSINNASFRDLETLNDPGLRPGGGVGFLNARNVVDISFKPSTRFRILSLPSRRRGTRNKIYFSFILVPHFRGDKPKFRNDDRGDGPHV
ncbi:MAG: hypothetical protein BGO67_01480 [Alphaproteobacteria bacterium 41-28]|nr:MAG: hypothetical protein BGO67_01480 [Alphaproteobacteria bacterium 41-28]